MSALGTEDGGLGQSEDAAEAGGAIPGESRTGDTAGGEDGEDGADVPVVSRAGVGEAASEVIASAIVSGEILTKVEAAPEAGAVVPANGEAVAELPAGGEDGAEDAPEVAADRE